VLLAVIGVTAYKAQLSYHYSRLVEAGLAGLGVFDECAQFSAEYQNKPSVSNLRSDYFSEEDTTEASSSRRMSWLIRTSFNISSVNGHYTVQTLSGSSKKNPVAVSVNVDGVELHSYHISELVQDEERAAFTISGLVWSLGHHWNESLIEFSVATIICGDY